MALLPEVQFRSLAEKFIRISTLLEGSWELIEWQDHVYLRKQVLQKRPHIQTGVPVETSSAAEEENTDEIANEESLESDSACLDVDDTSEEILKFDYHVVYSESYGVPVLYFNVYTQKGSLVSLDEVWSLVPQTYRERLQEERWTFITQQEHPYLGRPFYQLHPCHTSLLMDQITSIEQSKTSNYLVSWMSTVGPVVHLNLPMEYGLQVNNQ